jgi:hypothetical protein
MATYENPQAAMNVLMGGPPTPEEQEIASRILATDGGLPQALENMGTAPPSAQMAQQIPPQISPQVPPQVPLPNQQPTDEETIRSMERMHLLEARSGWLLMNEGESVPWDPNITWGQYLGAVLEQQGPEARDAIVDEQLNFEQEKTAPKEPPQSPMPILPAMPPVASNQQQIAGGSPGFAPPAAPPAEQGGIMMAANGGLVGFANGGLNLSDLTPEQYEEFVIAFPDWRRIFGTGTEDRTTAQERVLNNTLAQLKGNKNWTAEELRSLARFGGPDNWQGVGKVPETSDLPVGLNYIPSTERVLEVRSVREAEPVREVGPGFATGGIVGASQGAPVGEDEFMSVISQLSGEAGIPEAQLDAVAEAATQTAGAPAAANDNVMDSGIMQTVEAVDATDEDLSGIGSLAEMNAQLVETGQEGLVHATPGELIFDPSRLNEPDQRMLLAALETAGIDPNSATVGNEANILNQMTGLPAFGLFSGIGKIFKSVGKAVKKVGKFLKRNAGTILGIAGAMTGMPWLAALGSGIGSLIEGKPIQSALLSAGMSFAGTKWVGPWIGKQLQGIGSLGIGKGMQTPVGTALGSAGIGGPGGYIASQTTTGLAQTAAQKAAATAATNAALAAGEGLSKEGVMALAQTAASNAITATAGTGLGAAAIEKGATQIAQTAVDNVLAGTVTKAAGMAIPERVLTSAGTRLFSQPVGNLIGGAVAGGAQMVAEPYLQGMVSGVPAAEQQSVLDAWNAQYNYTPSSSDLFAFYTNEYVPNQQVNVAQTIGGIPGYGSPILAAGGGYIDGAGGPKSDSNLARLSDGEFVMTEASVRGAGYGDRIAGARRMYDIMNGLERRVA